MKEIILKVNGMVCGGCENRVKNALTMLEGVENVVASHTEGTVKVTVKEDCVDETQIKNKIEALGFEVL